ncbi:MAG: hypothetical protein R3E12_14860, partial [Candidatus Eisenbacteria bacterium]
EIDGIDRLRTRPFHVYDPRVTRIGDEIYVVLAADMESGCHLITARLTGASHLGRSGAAAPRLELIGITEDRESRNGVLFPERIGGRYCRLERPNARQLSSGVRTGDEVWLATSDDLVTWRLERPVFAGRPRYWDELVGSGPPPLKTREGWLHLYHGVATHLNASIYQAGVCLLDPEDPSKVIARGRNNILEPREIYETAGQVPNVVFPSGWIVDGRRDAGGCAPPDAVVRVYYGAADTCVAMAETTVAELLAECRLQ